MKRDLQRQACFPRPGVCGTAVLACLCMLNPPRLLQRWWPRPAPWPLPSLLSSSYFQGKRPRSGTSTSTDLWREEWGRVPEWGPRLDKKELSLQGYILQYKKTYISFAHNSRIWKCFALSSYFTYCTCLLKFNQLITNLISIWSGYHLQGPGLYEKLLLLECYLVCTFWIIFLLLQKDIFPIKMVKLYLS